MNRSLIEFTVNHLAAAVQAHVTHHGQPIFFRPQGTQTIGQGFGQHRQDPIGKVHRSAALPSLIIQRLTDPHIVGHISDRHHQSKATVVEGFPIHRVIKIAGVGAVNGDQSQLTQITMSVMPIGINHLTQALGLSQHRLWELIRQLVSKDRHIGGDAWLIGTSQYAINMPYRTAFHSRRMVDMHHHNLPWLRVRHLIQRHQNILRQTRIIRHHQCDATFKHKAANNLLMGALNHLNNAALFASATVYARHSCQHLIAMQHHAHLSWREIQVITALVGDHEAEAVGVGTDATSDEIHFARQPISSSAIAHHFTTADHALQHGPKSGIRLAVIQIQGVGQLAAR